MSDSDKRIRPFARSIRHQVLLTVARSVSFACTLVLVMKVAVQLP